MRIGIFGDIHGHWLAFREAILLCQAEAPLDLVLQVGDAQPIRDLQDLAFMPVPEKYRQFGSYAQIQEPWPVPMLEGEPGNLVLRPTPNLAGLGRMLASGKSYQ